MVLIDLLIKFTPVAMFVLYGFFFLLLIEIITIVKLLIIVHFFVFKHEKQILSYSHTKRGGRSVFLPQHRKLLAPERFMPL